MLQVEQYAQSADSKEIDTVIGRDLEGKQYSVILTTSGTGADNEKRNTLASFAKDKSNHHVPVGGMMLFSTVWQRDPETEGGPTTGIARWAEFFGNDRSELVVGNAMYRAGVNAENGGRETRWAAVDRMTKVIALTPDTFFGAVAALADKCASDRARARPIVRLMNDAGEVLDFTQLKQGSMDVVVDGENVRRAEDGAHMVESQSKNKHLTKILEAARNGEGALEMIPVMSVEMSKKMMNSARGANYVALAKRFSDANQVYAAECYIRRAPADDFNYISHLAVTNADRFDPLLVASEKFPAPSYSAALLAELGVESKTASQPAPTPAADPVNEDMERGYSDAPGFG
jgi:hypothetical protein